MRANIIADIASVSRSIGSGDSEAIFRALVEEVGELSTELNIRLGWKNRPPGPDGVVGEAIDALIVIVDFLETEVETDSPEFEARVHAKLQKWRNNVKRMS